jgi:hypothetical protein
MVGAHHGINWSGEEGIWGVGIDAAMNGEHVDVSYRAQEGTNPMADDGRH